MSQLNEKNMLNLFNSMLDEKNKNALAETLKSMSGDYLKGDEVDQVRGEREFNLNKRLHERDQMFMKKVEKAKSKILAGTFGECEDCGSQISAARLKARPSATLCIHCQEEKEVDSRKFFHNRRDLNDNKETLDFNSPFIAKKKISSIKDIEFESAVNG